MHSDSASTLGITDIIIGVLGFAAILMMCWAIRAMRPTHAIGRALRTLNREQRRAVAALGLILISALGITFFPYRDFLRASALDAGCDDTMFLALHPQLGALDRSQHGIVRRFVVLLREVSPSAHCNERALDEAWKRAAAAVREQLGTPSKDSGLGNFMDRRTENVSIELHSVEPRAAHQWQLQWTEHVHTPSGEPLRTAHLIAGGIARGESRQRV